MIQTIVEKLQLNEEKNLLIQGLPSSIEKQFCKLSFSKNVTPLLRSRKIDFALIFAVNLSQLRNILQDVLPAMHGDGKLWVAYPKATSKIVSDLNRSCSWPCLVSQGFEGITEIALDHVWTATRFRRRECEEETETVRKGHSDFNGLNALNGEKVRPGFQKVTGRKEKVV